MAVLGITILCMYVSVILPVKTCRVTKLGQAITEMTRQLRQGKGRNGLVLANGGVISYQHAVCLSSRPRDGPYPDSASLSVGNDTPSPPVDADATGPAVIEVSQSRLSI